MGCFACGKGVCSQEIDLDELNNLISNGNISIVINTPTKGNDIETEGFKLRRKATERRIPIFTCIDTAKLFLKAINIKKNNEKIDYIPLQNYFI